MIDSVKSDEPSRREVEAAQGNWMLVRWLFGQILHEVELRDLDELNQQRKEHVDDVG